MIYIYILDNLPLNTIHNKDCIEFMKKLPNECVSLIIADAPYFTTNIKEVGDNQWKKEADYIDWVVNNFKNYERILKENGSMYFFHNDINIMTEVLYRVKKETKFRLKNQITWDKLATGNQDFLMPLYKNSKLKRRYATSLTEYIYYFTFDDETGLKKVMCDKDNFFELRSYSKRLQGFIGLKLKDINKTLGHRRAEHFFYHSSTQWDICTEKVYEELIEKFNLRKFEGFRDYSDIKDKYNSLKKGYSTLVSDYEFQRYSFNQPYLITPKNIDESRNVIRPYSTVWHYKRDDEIYSQHLTPKPVEMIQHILSTSSKKGDVVYIPFAGSGSDIVACIKNNRNYIATETNNTYIEKIIMPRVNTYFKENKNLHIS
ncbi:site-specific DNA-methyltransferase [Clostridium sporogenes]|nr:site-specific DNA-methyltransferase [Clostridium sporogenes]